MLTTLVIIFVLAYAAIALEHPLHVNKSASALLGAGLLWTIYALGQGDAHLVGEHLNESLMGTAQIVFFLMGAMTIVEVVDAHNGFEVITSRIKTTKLSSLMWMVGFVAFFLSAILDNLTTTIVMVSLMKKLLDKREDRLFFAGIIIIAANAGGAWTPIGDVTTTMLWIGGQITAVEIMKGLFIPSMVNLLVPLAVTAMVLGNRPVIAPRRNPEELPFETSAFERNLMFYMGLSILVLVPVFKTVTHLPPFMGILLGLGVLWMVGDLVHRKTEDLRKQRLTLARALTRIDMSSIVFFIGILLSVAVLEHTHILSSIAPMAGQHRRAPGRHRHPHWLGQRRGRQRAFGRCKHGHVQPGAVPHRQLPVGVHGLLRRYRRLHPHHRLGRRCGCHGPGEDRLLLVHEAHQRPGPAGLCGRRDYLHRAVQPAALISSTSRRNLRPPSAAKGWRNALTAW